MNSYADDLNSFAESADTATSQIQDSINYFNYAIQSQLEAKKVLTFASKSWFPTKVKITKLPKTVKSQLLASDEYVEIENSVKKWKDFDKSLSDFFVSISSSTNIDYLSNANIELNSSEPEVSSNSIEYDFMVLNRLVPKYVCTKGKDVISMTGNTCKSGYKRINL